MKILTVSTIILVLSLCLSCISIFFGPWLVARDIGSNDDPGSPLDVDERFMKYHVGHHHHPALPANDIPKHIWTFWNDCPDQVILSFFSNWCTMNPGYDITVLTLKNYKDYIKDLDLDLVSPSLKDDVTKIADLIRLHALSQLGGFWVDASVLFTSSLDWIRNIQQDSGVEFVGFYLSMFTTNRKWPMLESWFFACVPGSPLVEQWRKDFMRLQDFPSAKEYIQSLRDEGVDLQRLGSPEYVALQAAMQRTLQKSEGRGKYRYHVMDSMEGPFYYLAASSWNVERAMFSLLNNNMTHRPIIKLRKWERKVLLPSFWLSLMPGQYFGRHIHPQPFFSKFGVDYDQQRDQLCNLSDDTCKIIKRLDGRKI